ncbi:MAG: SH3 domain-containing protein [Chromatiaceae bacterium]|nr:SH3 domain-containing protein [Gammaproteobacteria bacterium]MCP5300462.1 SH3 domain-containing protein [Chromatiaceae bacterium]MCP5422534.1 SH3 domain-containing protein [Chromatiaceae bacterium]
MLNNLVRLLATALLLAGAASAAHITDKLVVGVYPKPNAEGNPLRLIASGTPLDVLGGDGDFAEVRLADDTRGWVERRYVTEEKPANAMLLETQAKLRQMGLELAALRASRAESDGAAPAPSDLPPSAREAQLQQTLDEAEQHIAELQGKLQQQAMDADLQQRLEMLQHSARTAVEQLAAAQGLTLQQAVPQPDQAFFDRYQSWIIGGGALLLGFAGGIAFVDFRIRKRYGGFRI